MPRGQEDFDDMTDDTPDVVASPKPAKPIPWAQVEMSDKYRGLAPIEKERARAQYFNVVVAPNVPKQMVDSVRKMFESRTGGQLVGADYYKAISKPEAVDPTEGMSEYELGMARLGEPSAKLVQGAKQRLGMVSPEEVENLRQTDKPLLESGGMLGKAETLAGNILPAALTAPIPGVNTLAGAGVVGGTLGLLQPTGKGESVAQNVAAGVSSAVLGQKLGEKGAQYVKERASNLIGGLELKKTQNQLRDEALTKAREHGVVIQPSQAGKSSLLEGFTGVDMTKHGVSWKNQSRWNDMAERALDHNRVLGLPEGTPMTKDTLSAYRTKYYDAGYEPVKRLGTPFNITPEFKRAIEGLGGAFGQTSERYPNIVKIPKIEDIKADLLKNKRIDPEDAINLITSLREGARDGINSANASERRVAKAQFRAAGALEDMIDRNLDKMGKSGLLDNYRTSRTQIAKSFDVERALDPTTGNISAQTMKKLKYDKKRPLTGELSDMADIAKAFPKATMDVDKIGHRAPITPLSAAVGAISPEKTAALAYLTGRPLARSIMMSERYQNRYIKPPSYDLSSAERLLAGAAKNPYLLRSLPGVSAEGALLGVGNLEQ